MNVFDSRGLFVVGIRANGWANPISLNRELVAIDRGDFAADEATPHEVLFHAMAMAFGGGHIVQALPKGAGLCVLRFVTREGDKLKEGVPVFAAKARKNGEVEIIFDPENRENDVLQQFEQFRHAASPGRQTYMIRKFAEIELGAANIDGVLWISPRHIVAWREFVGAIGRASSARVSTVTCSVDEETAKAVMDHVIAARLKEANDIREKIMKFDPIKDAAASTIKYLHRRARELARQVELDESDLGIMLTEVREQLESIKLTDAVATVQASLAGVNES